MASVFRSWLLDGSKRVVFDCEADNPEEAAAKALAKYPGSRWVHTAHQPEDVE